MKNIPEIMFLGDKKMFIPAKAWSDMSTEEILMSISIALTVLERRSIEDKEMIRLLLDMCKRCIEIIDKKLL